MRQTTWALLCVGALGSLGLLLHKGRNGHVVVLVIMMLWVLGPFILLGLAHAIGKPWAVPITFVVTAGSLLVYGLDAAKPFRPQAAFAFVAAPSVWLALLACVAIISAVLSTPDVVSGPDR